MMISVTAGVHRLDQFKATLDYAPLTTDVMLLAAIRIARSGEFAKGAREYLISAQTAQRGHADAAGRCSREEADDQVLAMPVLCTQDDQKQNSTPRSRQSSTPRSRPEEIQI